MNRAANTLVGLVRSNRFAIELVVACSFSFLFHVIGPKVCPDTILEVQGDRKIRGFLKELYSWLGKNRAKYLKLILYVILMRSLAYYFLKQIS
ncbi:unnamed protein product [Sphagnum troendelagicum]|uniref:Uncharacterized protein n=1 Tax=Sphagnum troendelagicum TaxID=128251 RepID=A0ABP0TPW4_9BRYO